MNLLAQAQSFFLRCTGSPIAGEPMCTVQDLIDLIYRVVHFAVMVLAPFAVTAMLIYGAFLIILYGANPDFLKKGRSVMFNAVIGLLIVWGAWVIVNSIFWFFGFTLPCAHWYQITC